VGDVDNVARMNILRNEYAVKHGYFGRPVAGPCVATQTPGAIREQQIDF
jgi:hypothetical protein